MKKSYFLGLAMLLGVTGEGYAQKEIKNASDLTAARDSLSKMDVYNANIAENNSLINSYKVELGKEEPTKVEKQITRVPYGTEEKDAIKAFVDKLKQNIGEHTSLKIRIVEATSGGWETTSTLYVYAPGQNVEGIEGVKEVNTSELQKDGTDLVGSSSLGEIVVYYKRTNKAGVATYKEYYYGLPSSVSTNANVLLPLKTAASNLPEGEDDVEKEIVVENKTYTTLLNNIALYKTQNSYYNALINGGYWTVYSVVNGKETEKQSENSIDNGCASFKNIILSNNINSLPQNFTMGTWGEDYVFNGDGYSIEAKSTSLFGTNNGVIENLGVLNGNIVTRNNGTIRNSYERPSGSNLYNIYNEDGVRTSNQQLSPELAHGLRNVFGMDLGAGTLSLNKVTNDNKVFMVQYATHEDKKATTFYTNIKDGSISQSPVSGFESKNIFYYVEDADGRDRTSAINVVCKNGNVYECSSAVITDKGENIGLFILKDFTAKTVEYKRNVNTDIASVCFPFTVDYNVMKSKGVKNVMQFNGVDAATGIYWFKYMTGSLMANQPYMVSFETVPNSNVFDELTNVKFSATPDVNLYELAPEVDNTVGGNLRGTFVQTTVSVLAASQYDIYGYSAKTGDFEKKTDKATLGLCRAYIRSPRSAAAAKSFALGFLDENGNVVNNGGTTGIGSVTGTDGDSFSAKGGNNTIDIYTGKAQKVNVYTVGGSLVKVATVEAGSTSIPVAAGMYIVNGKKVVVK